MKPKSSHQVALYTCRGCTEKEKKEINLHGRKKKRNQFQNGQKGREVFHTVLFYLFGKFEVAFWICCSSGYFDAMRTSLPKSSRATLARTTKQWSALVSL